MPKKKNLSSKSVLSETSKTDGQKEVNNTQTNQERLSLLKSRLSVAKAFSKKPHEAWEKWIDEYEIADVGDTDEVRDKVRIGYVFRKTESEIPAIFDDQPDLFIKGRKGNIQDIEPLIESVYDYLWDIQHLEEKIEDVGVYFELLGIGMIESPYKVKTKTVSQEVQTPIIDPQTGQPAIDPSTGQPSTQSEVKQYEVPVIDNPDATVPNPFKIHFSPETVFAPVLDYEHCPYYFKELSWTPEEIKSKFKVDVEGSEILCTDDSDVNDEINRSKDLNQDDIKRVKGWEYYGCLPEKYAPKDSQWEYDKDYHIIGTANEELLVEECPYETKPLFIVGNYGLANKFWKFGDAKHLMPLIQELQMYRSQILQHTRKMANPKPLIPSASNVDEDAFRDPRVGKGVKFDGPIPPSYLSPANLGSEVGVGIDQARTDLEKTAPSFDLNNGSGQSTVKTPRGIQVYSEASDKSVRRKRKKIARLIRQLMIFQFQQIAQNWKPEDNRSINVLGENTKVDAMVLQVIEGVNLLYNLDIEVESLSVNRTQQKQDALDLFDLAAEHKDVFKLREMAKDLLINGYGKKDPDRYLYTEQEMAQMAKPQTEPPKTNISVKVDATTPVGAQILENEGVIKPGQAQRIMQNQQTIAAIQSQPLLNSSNPVPDQNATAQPPQG